MKFNGFLIFILGCYLAMTPGTARAGEPWQDREVRQLRYLFEKGRTPRLRDLHLERNWKCTTRWASKDHGGSMTGHSTYRFARRGQSRTELLNRGGFQAPVFRFAWGELFGNYSNGDQVFGLDVVRVNRFHPQQLIVEFSGPRTPFLPLYLGVWAGLYGVDPVSWIATGSMVVGYRICELAPDGV